MRKLWNAVSGDEFDELVAHWAPFIVALNAGIGMALLLSALHDLRSTRTLSITVETEPPR